MPAGTRPRLVIRYFPDGSTPKLNDSRIDEALEYALRECVMTADLVEVAGQNDAEETIVRVELHTDPLHEDSLANGKWTGSGGTMLQAVRRVLGDYYADWDMINSAYADRVTIDAYSDDSEIIRTRPTA